MTEQLLQYIWQHQYFNKAKLQTINGESVQIIQQGVLNKNQGPDFLNARIKIGDTVLAGSVELHLKASDWFKHGHEADPNYKNVILHVVFENDVAETTLPLIELQPHISNLLLDRYSALMNHATFIACANSLNNVKEITWTSWKERLLAERLIRKSALIFSFLEQNNHHWEESFWWLLARNFGITTNADAFEAIARSVSINVLAKQKVQIQQLEAMLLGQANLLNVDTNDEYVKLLQREYQFLKAKYSLKPIHTPVHFLRMRPSNFPTIRLAQLAMLIHQSEHLFSKIIETEHVKDIVQWLDVTANDYWHYHFRLEEQADYKPKHLGAIMIDNLIINTIVPMLFTYGHYHNDEKLKSRAVQWLEHTKAETNSIITNYKKLSIKTNSAFDTQALLELNKQYCTAKRCLQCSIGNAILKAN